MHADELTISYFDDQNGDLISKMQPLFQKGIAKMDPDTQNIIIKGDPQWETPWIHARLDAHRDCFRSFEIIVPYFNFVPIKCQNCWKVVARPRNLSQMVKVLNIQQRLGYFSKSGIERRPYVFGNYGSYWYCNSIEEGLRRKDEVTEILHREVSSDIPVILKRACTEFEKKFGRTDQWQVSEEQEQYEEFLRQRVIVIPEVDSEPSDLVEERTKLLWVEFAYDRGDESYKEFTNGQPLYPPLMNYEWAKEETQDGAQPT